MPPRKKSTSPAAKPNLVCPFTGTEIQIRRVADGLYFQGVGAFYSTRLYGSEEELVYDLSTRDGVAPAFPRRTKIEVRVVEPPPTDPVSDLRDLAQEHQALAEEAAKDFVKTTG